ncbi:AraC family transcriptional regulator [Microbacterium pumilum]|uniref:AraC family transcriptional regulator n=2 Tax=Microbacterium pumilum TaxID=344165 RepID=A0ABP5D1R3_9MICO
MASAETFARTIIESPAARELIPHPDGESFRWIEHDYPCDIARWNYHPEVEIHLIRRSSGSFIIGDEVGAFGPGHVAIVGSEVPHDWMSDLAPNEVIGNRDAVIQFTIDWLESGIQAIPELQPALKLIDQSRRGIVFSGATAATAAVDIEAVGATTGARRMAHFFALLDLMMNAPEEDRHYVTQELYAPSVGREGKAAVDAGLAYVLENLSGEIRLSEAARLAYMSEPSFSKYFKKASGMTFSDLVRRLRISNACRLLDHSDSSIADICAAVGYRNLANFNRQFRAETGLTPSAYRALDDLSKPSIGLLNLNGRRSGR